MRKKLGVRISSVLHLAAITLFMLIGTAGQSLAADPFPPEEPLYIYSFTGNPAIEHDLGVLTDILLTLGEIPNKALKEKMDAVLSERYQGDRFRQAFGCMLVVDKSAGCRRVIFLASPPFERNTVPSKHLIETMGSDNKAWVLHVTEQFHVGGYFLSGTASRIYSDESGQQKLHRVHATYWTSYSKRLDALQRSIDVNDKRATPRLGSKEAVASFWYGGSPAKLESEIDKSPHALGEMLSVVMALPVGSRSVSASEQLATLPKLRTLQKSGTASWNSQTIFS